MQWLVSERLLGGMVAERNGAPRLHDLHAPRGLQEPRAQHVHNIRM